MHNAKIGNAKNLSRFEANISVYLSAAVVFVIALFWGGRQPFAVGLFDSPYDKIAHILAFSFPSLSLWFGVKERWPLFIIILASTIGALDEIHQLYLPGREAAFSDFVADFVGSWFTVAYLKSMLGAS